MGRKNVQLVRGREAVMRRKRILTSPLGGLQILAGGLNELTGLRAQFVESDRPSFVKDEVAAWTLAERVVSQPLTQAVDLFNMEARTLPMLLQAELVQGEPATFIASQEKHSDRRGDVLRLLWWYYFPKNECRRLKQCPVCRDWFVDTSRNRVTERCSSECTTKWWNRDRRTEAGHKGTQTGTARVTRKVSLHCPGSNRKVQASAIKTRRVENRTSVTAPCPQCGKTCGVSLKTKTIIEHRK